MVEHYRLSRGKEYDLYHCHSLSREWLRDLPVVDHGQILLAIITLLVGTFTAWSIRRDNEKKDIRNREWLLEDRAHLAKKIDENTQISKGAFEVANHVNEKIAAIGSIRLKASARNLSGKKRRSGD